MAELTPCAYKAGDSFLHRLPAGLKLAGLLAVSFSAFVFQPFGIIFSAILIVISSFSAKIPLRLLFRGCGFILFMAFTVVFFRSISWQPLSFTFSGFQEGLYFALGLLAAFAGCSLFFSVTTMGEVKDALDYFFQFFSFIPGLSRAGLGVSLMLGFLPRFFEIWESAETAYRARGGKNNIKKLVFLTTVTIERMIELAVATADALEIRGVE
jgi:biotin transport system permease protein